MQIRLGEYLVNNEYITKDELEDALLKQQDTTNVQSRQLGNILLSLGIMTESEVTTALNEHSGGFDRYKPILDKEITIALVTKFPLENFSELNILPVEYIEEKQTLLVGTVLDNTASIELALARVRDLYPKIKFVVSKVLEHSYATFFNRYAKVSNKAYELPTIQVNATEKLKQIYRAAVDMGASDIHIFWTSTDVIIKFRVARDFITYDRVHIPLSMREEVDRSLANQCNLPQGELNLGQIDAAASDLLRDGKWKARVNMQQSVKGMAHVLRLIPKFQVIGGFNSLNLTPGPREYMEELISDRSGLVLVTGPMGSGKNYTITGMVVELNDGNSYIVTVEDPVEMLIEGVVQVEINSKTTSFGDFGRSILRQDCDVMYLGEIRDQPSLETAIKGGNAGMLVMSTLHTKSVSEVFTRIDTIDKTAYKQAVGALTGLLNQRLIRKLCPHCKQEIKFEDLPEREQYIASATLQTIMGTTKNVKYKGKLYRAVGCPACKGRGYKGAAVCIEYLKMSPSLRQELGRCKDTVDAEKVVRAAALADKTSIEFDGLYRLREGIVDITSLIKEGVFRIQ